MAVMLVWGTQKERKDPMTTNEKLCLTYMQVAHSQRVKSSNSPRPGIVKV